MATTSTLKSYYTWDNSNFSWDSTQCNETWDAFGIYGHRREDVDSIAVKDHISSKAFSKRSEFLYVSERHSSNLSKLACEQLSFKETYWDNIGFIMHFIESLSIDERNSAAFQRPVQEVLSLHDYVISAIRAAITENVSASEQVQRLAQYQRQLNEVASIEPTYASTPTKYVDESLYVAEQRTMWLRHIVHEAVVIVEALLHKAQVKRTLTEAFSLSKKTTSFMEATYKERIALVDSFLRACGGVIADIALTKGKMTLDQFEDLIKCPPGYEPFIPYNVGEYEYQKALVRLLVTAGSMGSEPAVYDAVVNVDIDDTVDRGTVAITDTIAAAKIYFNKHYYTKPEISVTLQAGNTADGVITPNIVSIDSDQDGFFFTVELLKTDGTRATGKITWNSVGY